MPLVRKSRRAFALFEVLIGLSIFAIGILALGRSVQNCMNASMLSAEEDRIRQILSNRMAEIQATPGTPDTKKETKIETGYGEVKLKQLVVQADLKDDKDQDLTGINLVTLTAEWSRHGINQSRKIEFYVYRTG